MDSRMLEVAIGLVLIFALFGLLVTSIHEALAQSMKSRGKTLRVAVLSLLGDDATLSDALMQHPLLVSMAETNAASRIRPSYLSSDVFVSALLDHLSTRYMHGDKPVTPAEFVTQLTSNLPGGLTASLRTLLPGAETDWPAYEKRLCAWYDAVGDRATGWYKRKTQRDMLLIGTVAAAIFNINPIVIGPRLWDDDPLRKSLVTAGEQASKAFSDETAKGTSGDPAAAALSAADKAGAAAIAALKGLPTTGASLKVAATTRSKEVEEQLVVLRQQLDTAASAALGRRTDASVGPLLNALTGLNALVVALDDARLVGDGSIERQRKSTKGKLDLQVQLAGLRTLAASPSAIALGADLPGRVDRLHKAIEEELKDREGPPPGNKPKPPGDCDQASSAEGLAVCQKMNDLRTLQLAGLPVGWSPPYLPDVVQAKKCSRIDWTTALLAEHVLAANAKPELSPPAYCAGWGLLANPNIWFALFGWLVMGMAGTLGATFWFDLLTRFVKLRGAGGKPDTTAATTDNAAKTEGTAVAAPGAGGVMARSAEPAPAPRAPVSSDVLNAAEAVLTVAEVEEIQRRLLVTPTGYFDQATRDAIAARQRQELTAETGELSAADIAKLLGRSPMNDGDGFVG